MRGSDAPESARSYSGCTKTLISRLASAESVRSVTYSSRNTVFTAMPLASR